MGKTRGMRGGFKVKKLRIRQRWALKKYKKSRVPKKKKLGINQTLVDEQSYVPYLSRPPFPGYKKSAVIQIIQNGDEVTMKYIGENEPISYGPGVLDTFPVSKSNCIILS